MSRRAREHSGVMRPYPYGSGQRRGGRGLRVIVALVIAGVSLVSYLSSKSHNEVTGEDQYVDLTPQQEISLGLASVPAILQQYGGDRVDGRLSSYVTEVGSRVVKQSAAAQTPYKFAFHVLDDSQTVNAFALPGGQVFITTGLIRRLGNEADLAAVLGHEVGHVVGRHGAEHLAKAQLTQGLAAAYVVGADDPNDPYDTRRNAAIAMAVSQLVNLKYSRGDELEADALGVRFIAEASYDPKGMLEVMQVLKAASAGSHTPEFFSTHPNPENRLEKISGLLKQTNVKGGDRNEDAFRKRALSVLGVSPTSPSNSPKVADPRGNAVVDTADDTAAEDRRTDDRRSDDADAVANPPPRVAPRGEPVAKSVARVPGLRVAALSSLPNEARRTVELIARGGPFPYSRDGIPFQNREGILPGRASGYYREYTVPTPGESDRGARRVITGANGELFYTADHYQSFVQIDPES